MKTVFSLYHTLGSLKIKKVTDQNSVGKTRHIGCEFRSGPGSVSKAVKGPVFKQPNYFDRLAVRFLTSFVQALDDVTNSQYMIDPTSSHTLDRRQSAIEALSNVNCNVVFRTFQQRYGDVPTL